MQKPRVYIETSVFSYLAARPGRNAISLARQIQTRQWRDLHRGDYELIVSSVVEPECEPGDQTVASRGLGFLVETSRIATDEQTLALAKTLVGPGKIPANAEADAIHIAAAVLSNCQYLLTWNFRHIANA
jgi:hypothetical protein